MSCFFCGQAAVLAPGRSLRVCRACARRIAQLATASPGDFWSGAATEHLPGLAGVLERRMDSGPGLAALRMLLTPPLLPPLGLARLRVELWRRNVS